MNNKNPKLCDNYGSFSHTFPQCSKFLNNLLLDFLSFLTLCNLFPGVCEDDKPIFCLAIGWSKELIKKNI